MGKARQLSLWDPHLTRASATVCLGQGPPAPTTEEPNSEDATSHQRCAILLISKERPSSAGLPAPRPYNGTTLWKTSPVAQVWPPCLFSVRGLSEQLEIRAFIQTHSA